MSRRKPLFFSQLGFGLLGALLAIVAGSAIAALVAMVLSTSVRGQRALADRDETSEFSQFIKSLLMSDTSCTQILKGRKLKLSGESPLEISGMGYANQPPADIKKGYSFAIGSLEIRDLTLENTTVNPIQFKLTREEPKDSGKFIDRLVRRHMVRVKLEIASKDGSAFYRPKYFEFPVLLGEGNEIEACNNEVNAGDACQSMGFRWDTNSTPPVCVPGPACLVGGHYRVTSTGACSEAHHFTGECRCPAGFESVEIGATSIAVDNKRPCSKGCDQQILLHNTTVQCFKCQ